MAQSEKSMSQQIESILDEIVNTESDQTYIFSLDDQTIQIKEEEYKVVTNYREGFDFDAFKQRYQDYFAKFEFIVGDWGYDQLRLKGFYQLNKKKAPMDQTINNLDDYLKEYCNFGCRYFVLAKTSAVQEYQTLLKKYEAIDSNTQFKYSRSNNVQVKSSSTKSRRKPRKTQKTSNKSNSTKDDYQVKTKDQKENFTIQNQKKDNRNRQNNQTKKKTVKANNNYTIKKNVNGNNRGQS